MYSIAFPKMFNTSTAELVQDKKAIVQNLKLLLQSEKRELVCDPYFGDNLKRMIFDKGNVLLRDILIDDILVTINTFMPQVKIKREDIAIEIRKNDIICKIYGITDQSVNSDVLDILLTQFEEEV